MNKKEVLNLIKENVINKKIEKLIFSDLNINKIEKIIYKKIIIKAILLKDKFSIQIESFTDKQSFHSNYMEENFENLFLDIEKKIENYKQILFRTKDREYILNKKNECTFSIKERNNILKSTIKNHNHKKEYILKEGEQIDFLIELGIMTKEGKIIKNSYNKFKQINKYLEFIDVTIKELSEKRIIKNHINILDFGCGKSYLTFALYYYLTTKRKELSFSIIGLDLKKEVIELCNRLVKKLNYKNIEFLNINIKDFKGKDVDLVFSLHACNNATDYSILKALELKSKAILAVPCCHNEFYSKISKSKNSLFKEKFKTMANNGIILEKFSTLATDSFRSLALELCSYKVKMIEFVDMEHTPKNILIKAIKTNKINLDEKLEEYENFKKFLGISPMLEDLIKKYYIMN